MLLRVFDIHDEVANAFVVFAGDELHALSLAREHMASYRFASPDVTVIERFPATAGRSRVHLLAAIEAGVAGIGHRQRDGSWIVLPPGDRSARHVQPHPTKLHAYVDDEDGYEVVLFAADQRRADDLWIAIQADFGAMPDAWRGTELEAWNAVGLVRHQRHAEARGIEGLGVHGSSGWAILPLDYQALGVLPPDP